MNWNKESIRELLEKNDRAVWRAVHRIYQNQTESEKMTENTHEDNGVGFTGADAYILTNFAKFYIKTGYLTTKQTAYARKKIKKYWRQLLQIINEGR
jgi:hypothetical protein